MKGITTLILGFGIALTVGNNIETIKFSETTPLVNTLEYLGEPLPNHYIEGITLEQIERGEELVKIGLTTNPPKNEFSRKVGSYNCNSCHNQVQEFEELFDHDSQVRLEYAEENELPFLPGSSFFGMVNKESWYNGGYQERYKNVAPKANTDLREAIQLCAIEGAEGRSLMKWETEAILAYLWTLQYNLSHLCLSEDFYEKLEKGELTEEEKKEAIEYLKSKYQQESTATFVDVSTNRENNYELIGNSENGARLYKQSCQSCHNPNQKDMQTVDLMDDSKETFKRMANSIEDSSSIYELVRGNNAKNAKKTNNGHRLDMLHYSIERMSEQQVEDLKVYIEEQAKD